MDSGKNIGFKQANGNMPQQKNPSKSFRVASSPGAELINERRKPTTTAPDNLFLSVSGRGLKTSLYLLHTWSRSFHQAFLSAHLLFIYLFLFPLSLPAVVCFTEPSTLSPVVSPREDTVPVVCSCWTRPTLSPFFCFALPSPLLLSPHLFLISFWFNLILIWNSLNSSRSCSVNNCCFPTMDGWNPGQQLTIYFHSLWIGRYFLLLIN